MVTEKFESKKYPIKIEPYEGTDRRGWTFETEKYVLEFLEQADHSLLLKVCDLCGLHFENGNEHIDDEQIVLILRTDSTPRQLLNAIEKLGV